MNPSIHPSINHRGYSRKAFLQLLDAAFESGSFRFARQASLNWLAVFPGDLTIQLCLGKAHLAEGKIAQALAVVERVCRFDPQYLEAQQVLETIYRKMNSEKWILPYAAGVCLGQTAPSTQEAEWIGWHLAARAAIQAGDHQAIEPLLRQVMCAVPEYTLAAVDHLNHAWGYLDRTSLYKLAEQYHKRWPDCLQFALRLAEIEIEFGNETCAVELLHQCVANDASGHAAQRLWGVDHRYLPLWPEGLEIRLDLPIPSEVAFLLGWNRLPAGELPPPAGMEETDAESVSLPSNDTTTAVPVHHVEENQTADGLNEETGKGGDETVKAVEEIFARLAKQMKHPALGRADGRFPVYVIFSSVQGLEAQYGGQTRAILMAEMKKLAVYVAQRPGWNSLVFLPDDGEALAGLGMKPVEGLDPWKFKLALVDLDQALAKKGQMIGALLIVGGGEVVPFHRLPNPTSDVDQDVPSDNPYATLDSNYFVPEWPVGRLPGAAGKDAMYLIEQMRFLNQYHAKKAKVSPQLGNLVRWLLEFLRQRSASQPLNGLGYSAAVWKESSALVLKSMNERADLKICPPTIMQDAEFDQWVKPSLEYFNLHGLSDAAEWYGQKDAGDLSGAPDYPVALSPKNIIKNGKSPQIVYSEACYGAFVTGKCEEQSIALKFLSIGSRGFVGSTTIAYGSVCAPLIGADLLGYHFWRCLREGSTVGEALLQAKISLAKEMNQRQGFLDGEDQKTLISFVLYGDPLAGYEAFQTRSKATLRFKNHPSIKTICDRPEQKGEPVMISQAALKEVKAMVAGYLPGMEEAEVRVNALQEGKTAKGRDPQDEATERKTTRPAKRGSVVVTMSKSVRVARNTFHHYARVTLNEKGKVIKLTVSR